MIAEEAQFLAPDQIDQLARVVDDLDVDVYAFGITTDFRSKLFPGSQRLVELADRVEVRVKALSMHDVVELDDLGCLLQFVEVDGRDGWLGSCRRPWH